MSTTSIEWTATHHPDGTVTPGVVWNPVRGCTRVSTGCEHCYAERMAYRFSGPNQPYEGLVRKVGDEPRWTGQVRLVTEALTEPLGWRTPRRVFVNSMSDLWHDGVPDSFIWDVFAVMAAAPQHTFQVLTKRPARMLSFLGQPGAVHKLSDAIDALTCHQHWADTPEWSWPLPNVWLGVSVETQQYAEERIPLLLSTPAAIRWVSAEPLLGPLDLTAYLGPTTDARNTTSDWHDANGWRYDAYSGGLVGPNEADPLYDPQPGLHWVVCGGESGPGARPMYPDWARRLRDDCVAAGVAFFFKQRGAWTWDYPDGLNLAYYRRMYRDGQSFYRVGKKLAGALLDGRTWQEYPEVSRS